eukprot:479703_1
MNVAYTKRRFELPSIKIQNKNSMCIPNIFEAGSIFKLSFTKENHWYFGLEHHMIIYLILCIPAKLYIFSISIVRASYSTFADFSPLFVLVLVYTLQSESRFRL